MKHAATQPTRTTAVRQRPARSAAATADGRFERPNGQSGQSGQSGSFSLPDGLAGDAGAAALQADPESRDAQIHRLAYERYLNNGCVDGHALDDWLAAEAAVGALGLGGDGAAADRQPGA